MKYAIEVSSGAMTYIPIFIKIVFRHSKVDGGMPRQTDSLLLLFRNKRSRLKISAKTLHIFSHVRNLLLFGRQLTATDRVSQSKYSLRNFSSLFN